MAEGRTIISYQDREDGYMHRAQRRLLLIGVGGVTLSLGILMIFIAPETQALLLEKSQDLSHPIVVIVTAHGVDLMIIGCVVLGILLFLTDYLLHSKKLVWFPSLGVGAVITTIPYPVRRTVALHAVKGGVPLGWLVWIVAPGIVKMYGVIILSYLIDLLFWSLVAKMFLNWLSSERFFISNN